MLVLANLCQNNSVVHSTGNVNSFLHVQATNIGWCMLIYREKKKTRWICGENNIYIFKKYGIMDVFCFFLTFPVPQPKLSVVVSAPAKHTPRHGEREALLTPRSNLDQRDCWQGLEVLGWNRADLPLPHTKLASGVLTPRIHLTICGGITMSLGTPHCSLQNCSLFSATLLWHPGLISSTIV